MSKVLLILLLFINLCFLSAQLPPDTLWTKTFNDEGVGLSVIQTSDNCYVTLSIEWITGYNILITKTDNQGNEIWSNYLGYPNLQALVTDFALTTDGGFIITGTADIGNGYDAFLIKSDEYGNQVWDNTYHNLPYIQNSYSVIQTNDSGFMLTGREYFINGLHKLMLLKTDVNGFEILHSNFDYNTNGRSLLQTSDGGFIVVGTKIVDSENNIFVLKSDCNGNEEWSNTYGIGEGYSIINIIDNKFVIVGINNQNFSIIKISELGVLDWSNTFNGLGCSITQASDSGFIISGSTGFTGYYNMRLVKIDSLGIEEWSKNIGHNTSYESANDVILTTDNEFILVGYTHLDSEQNTYLVKVNAEFESAFSANNTFGNIPFEIAFIDESVGNPTHWFWDFQNDGIYDSFIQNPNYTYLESGVYDVKLKIMNETQIDSLIKFNYITVNSVGCDEELLPMNPLLFSNYPNPFNPSTTIEFSIQIDSKVDLTILNTKGQKIKTLTHDNYTQGTHSIIWNGNDELGKPISSGIYLYELKVNGKTEAVKKCLLLK